MTALGVAATTAGLVLASAVTMRRLHGAAAAARAAGVATVRGGATAVGSVALGSTAPTRARRRLRSARLRSTLDAVAIEVAGRLQAADVALDPATCARRWVLGASVTLLVAGGRWGAGGVVVASALVVGGPVAVLAWRRGREAQRYGAALPALLEAVAGRLRAGASLVDAVAGAADDPTGSAVLDADLRAVRRRVDHGQPFADTIEAWARQRPVPGVGLVAAALVLGTEAGGARAHALDGVAATLRDRRALAAEVQALSSQARASAVVMMGAPVVFATLGLLSDPGVSAFLLRTPAGLACLVGGLALDAVAGVWMVRIAGQAA